VLFRSLKEIYAPHFWLTFWSDQFFRAHCYVACMCAGHTAIAQQLAARKLSFWFIKNWRSVDDAKLITLHAMLYQLDYTAKTGGDTELLEHVYQQWFCDKLHL